MCLGHFVVYLESLLFHLPHYLPRLLVFELIQLIVILQSPSLGLLLLPLLLLLHHDLVPHHLLQDNIVEDVPE